MQIGIFMNCAIFQFEVIIDSPMACYLSNTEPLSEPISIWNSVINFIKKFHQIFFSENIFLNACEMSAILFKLQYIK